MLTNNITNENSINQFFCLNQITQIIKQNPNVSEVRETNEQVLLKINNEAYVVQKSYFSSGHRYGDGGESKYEVFLIKNNHPILKSSQDLAYYTYSDDSEDYTTKDIRETSILKEDGLARFVFEKLKKLPKPPRAT